MGTIRVLLCCGAGFSSGFLAQKARQAAKKKKIDMTIEARSESVVSEYMDKMDVLLVGPHYASALPKFQEQCGSRGICVDVIPERIYAALDGESLVDLAQRLSEKQGEGAK